MLILCSGPDSYRALAKAQELERAFREKFDKSGSSIERLVSSDGLEALAKRMDTISLFSPKRFIRFDGLVTLANKQKKMQLATILSKNVEGMIVVTVEEDAPEAKQLDGLKQIPKFVHYPFPLPTANQFETWLQSQAQAQGFDRSDLVRKIATRTWPDAWQAMNELLKVMAGGQLNDQTPTDPKYFEEVLLNQKKVADQIARAELNGLELMSWIMAARTLVKVKGGQTQGLHPFVVQKYTPLVEKVDIKQIFSHLTEALVLQRAGFGSDEELIAVL